MPDWSVRIVPVDASQPAGPAQFNAPGQPPNTPLIAQDGDIVTWNNTTDTEHQPWPTDENYNPLPVKKNDVGYMSDPIPARDSSTPAYPVTLADPAKAQTFYYYCAKHPQNVSERSAIDASPVS